MTNDQRPTTNDHLTEPRAVRWALTGVVLAFLTLFLLIPLVAVFSSAFAKGVGPYFAAIQEPDAIAALKLTLLAAAIAVPCNLVFGVCASWAIAKFDFPGKSLLTTLVDLPFAVSPVVVGVALILLWGSAGLFGFVENNLGFKIIFGFPGIVLASIFVTVPFVIREVEPVLHEIGTDQEEAAFTLGSQWWQTFWRVTLPSIRWGVTYGIVLTIARTLGEVGVVIMVSSNLPGTSQTLTLLVADRYSRGTEYGAYAVSTLLMTVAVIVLIVQVVLDSRRHKTCGHCGAKLPTEVLFSEEEIAAIEAEKKALAIRRAKDKAKEEEEKKNQAGNDGGMFIATAPSQPTCSENSSATGQKYLPRMSPNALAANSPTGRMT